MSSASTPRPAQRPRPKYYDLSLAHLPPGGRVSIFHRVSGVLLFFPLLPFLLYVMQDVLGSDEGFARWQDFFAHPLAKLAMLGVIWLAAHHFWAGIRFLVIDLHFFVERMQGRRTAAAVFILGILTTALLGWRMW